MKTLLLTLLVFSMPVAASNEWHNEGWIADYDMDGYVNVVDLGILARNYGATFVADPIGSESNAAWAAGDRNFDNRVDVVDLGVLARYYDDAFYYYNWPPVNGVPEPTTMLLLGAGGVALLRKHHG